MPPAISGAFARWGQPGKSSPKTSRSPRALTRMGGRSEYDLRQIPRRGMTMRRTFQMGAMALLVLGLALRPVSAKEVTLRIKTPMAPPNWALLERALLRANTPACKEFFRHYFAERAYLLAVDRW